MQPQPQQPQPQQPQPQQPQPQQPQPQQPLQELEDIWTSHDLCTIAVFRARMFVDTPPSSSPEVSVRQFLAPHALKYIKTSPTWTLGGTTLHFIDIFSVIVVAAVSPMPAGAAAGAAAVENAEHVQKAEATTPSAAISATIKNNLEIALASESPFLSWTITDAPMMPDPFEFELALQDAGGMLTSAEALALKKMKPEINIKAWPRVRAEGDPWPIRTVVAGSCQDPETWKKTEHAFSFK
jgi:hypothetical protein